MKKKKEERVALKLSEITKESSLGWLAYGDIAFTTWRRIKQEINEKK